MVEQPFNTAKATVDTSASEAECRARLFADPDDIQAMRRLGWLCGQHGRLEEGRDWLERALALQPQSTELQLTAAVLAAAAGETEAAESAYRKILAHSPNASAAQTGLGHIAQGRKQWSAAEQYFRAALKLAPDALDALLGLGQSRLAVGDAQQAARWFMRATQLYPQHPLALTRYAQAMLTLGDAQAAARPLIRALEIDPNFIEARSMLGQVELVRGRAEAAETNFRSVLANAPNVEAYAGLGHALRMQQRFAEAVDAYDNAIGAGQSNEQLVTERAACLLRSGQANTAVTDLLGYIEKHKRCELPRLLLARIYDQIDHADDALGLWQDASRADAHDSLAQAELAQRLELRGDFDACVEALNHSAADKRVPTTLLRARTALRAKDLVIAQRELLSIPTKGLLAEPAIERYRMLGVVHDRNHRYAEAVLAFREAQRIGAVPLPSLAEAGAVKSQLQAMSALEELETPRLAAPVLLIGLPGSDVEAIAALLGDQEGVEVRTDRFGEQFDLFADPSDPRLVSPLTQAELGVLAKRYARVQQRSLPNSSTALVIDWLPVFDARTLAQARRVLPGLRAICVDAPDQQSAFLHWLAFGWAHCHATDPLDAARWWHRAAEHLALVDDILPTIHVQAASLLAAPKPAGDELAEFLDLPQLVSGSFTQQTQRNRMTHAVQFELSLPAQYKDVLGGALAAL